MQRHLLRQKGQSESTYDMIHVYLLQLPLCRIFIFWVTLLSPTLLRKKLNFLFYRHGNKGGKGVKNEIHVSWKSHLDSCRTTMALKLINLPIFNTRIWISCGLDWSEWDLGRKMKRKLSNLQLPIFLYHCS